jgi:hypothetical protein
MKKDITALFCLVDDFYKSLKQEIEKRSILNGVKLRKPTRIPGLSENEIMTIILMFHFVIFDYRNLLAGILSIFTTPTYSTLRTER